MSYFGREIKNGELVFGRSWLQWRTTSPHIVCCPGTVCSVLNILKLLQLISSAVLEITAVETGHSICSAPSLKLVQPRVRGIFQKARAAGMKREPGVRFKWASLKLRSMQHIAELPPLSTDSTLRCVTYKLAGSRKSSESCLVGGNKGSWHSALPGLGARKVEDGLNAWTATGSEGPASHGGSGERSFYWFRLVSHKAVTNRRENICLSTTRPRFRERVIVSS